MTETMIEITIESGDVAETETETEIGIGTDTV